MVSASDVANAAYCPYRILNGSNGCKVNPRVGKQVARGNKRHEYQNRVGVDRRCYVATYAYGGEAPETELLRSFRDQVLMPSVPGRCLVRAYYFLSPGLVRACQVSPVLSGVVNRCLRLVVSLLS